MPASSVRTRSRVAAPPKPTPAPAPTEAAITRMLAQPAPAAHPDEALLALGRRFDELHAAWMVTVEADREPTERFNAHIKAAKVRGGPTLRDHEAAWALPGVMESHDRELAAFGALDPLFKAIKAMPTETVEGLAVKARALTAASWADGNYLEDRCLGSDEEWPLDLIRNLVEATCRLAGVDWQGKPVATARGEPSEPTVARVVEADPVHVLIAEHRAAYAKWDRLSIAWAQLEPSSPGYAEAYARGRADCDGPGMRESALLEALMTSKPTTLAGITALAEYLPGALRQVDPETREPDSERALRSIAAALRALDAPPAMEPSLADQIIACWRGWSARPDFDESPEADRLSSRRDALIDAAEALPATPENVLPKALASAWLEYVALWGNGQPREEYGTDGRLALDIDTAICGRLKTHYVKARG